MSRIGKLPIQIPDNVDIAIDNGSVTVKGPKGELRENFNTVIDIVKEDKTITVKPKQLTQRTKALWGTYWALLKNMVIGVTDGYEKILEYEGVGYRAEVKSDSQVESGQVLELNLGFSHPVRVPAPAGISFQAEKGKMTVSGIDKRLVGETAARIRKLRPPEPYKGKGIRYQGEVIMRKAGKKAMTAG